MTISSQLKRLSYSGNGSTTSFAYSFRILDQASLKVVVQSAAGVDSVKTITTDYTVSGVGSSVGGAVVFVTAPVLGETVSIILDPELTQLTDYSTGGAFPAQSHEDALDKQLNLNKRTRDLVDRSIHISDGDSSTPSLTVPSLTQRASKVLTFDSSGNVIMTDPATASGTTVTATGTTTARTLQERFAEAVNVKDFGALGNGSTDDRAAFQAAIDSTTDGRIAVIFVPTGAYVGNMSTLAFGTRTVVWQEHSNTTYSTAQPLGNRTNARYNGDSTRPWFVGKHGFHDNATTGLTSDRPTVRVQRTASHTGGTAGGSANNSALNSEVLITGAIDNYENAIIGSINCQRTTIGGSVPNFTSVQGISFKHEPSTCGIFGANFVARDQTTRASSVSRGGLIGTEIGLTAAGPDDSGLRTILDVIGRGYDNSIDGASSIAHGINVRPSEGGTLSAEPMKLDVAINVTEGSLGSVGTGLAVDGGNVGVNLTGTYTTAAIETRTAIASVVRFGSTIATPGAPSSRIIFSGNNVAAAKVDYSAMINTVQVNTAGAHTGKLSLNVVAAGTETTAMELSGASSANPVFLRINSSLKQVTEGAADSGGGGFKVLRVPN